MYKRQINACVSFLRPEPSAPPAEESSPSFSVAEVPLSVSVPSSVESTSPISSVVSRQVSVVVPPLRVGASTLNPYASLFRPRATSLPRMHTARVRIRLLSIVISPSTLW